MQTNDANKTEQLVNEIFHAILDGRYLPGTAVPSEREIHRTTGHSRVTIRRAYGRLVDAGILERRHGSGTYVAAKRQGAVNHRGIVGLLAAEQLASGVFGVRFLKTLESSVRKSGQLLGLRLTGGPETTEAGAIDLVSHQVRNLVIWQSAPPEAADAFARLHVLGVNMVFFDLFRPGAYADFVGLDNEHAVLSIMDWALGMGRRSFVFVAHADSPGETSRLRQTAFEMYCRRRRLDYRVVAVPWDGDVDAVLREYRTEWFGKSGNPAVICVNDEVALKVRSLLAGDVPVCGIDGLPQAAEAGIVSYAQPIEEMAETALDLIRRQQKLGSAWTPRQVRCRGALS